MTLPLNTPPGRLAVCSWSLQPTCSADLLASLQRTGISAVSLALSPIVDHPSAWSTCLADLQSAGIDIVSGMMQTRGEDYSSLDSIARTGGLRPENTWNDNVAHANKVAQVAAEAGIDLVTFHAGFLPHDPADSERAVIMQRIRTLGELFSATGVNLALETGQERAETLLEVLHELDAGNIGVNFDPANMILYNMGDPVSAIRDLAAWVKQVHIKDAISTNEPGTWGKEVPVGAGEVDWASFLQEVVSLPSPVDLVIERESGESRVEDVRQAAQLVGTLIGSGV